MAEDMAKPRLGRGLAALIGEVGDEMSVVERGRGQRRVPIEFLRSNPRNPRKAFPESELHLLASSIRERGLIQPIIVRPLPHLPDAYEIVAGERRWRASQIAGLHDVPVVVVDVDDRTSLEYAILENVQRSDLNPIEEAQGYTRLLQEFGYSHEELSKILGKSRPHLTNTTRLLGLPDAVKDMLIARQLTAGHARMLLSVADPVGVARRVVDEGLSVRAVEAIAHAEHADDDPEDEPVPAPARRTPVKDPDTRALEKALEDVLGLAVSIRHKAQGGEISIKYKSLEQLDGLCRRLNPGS
jgi:ParB family transcriptional regulator, chromosome partitioning protein